MKVGGMVAGALALGALSGCDQIKSLAGGGADGGASSSSSPGILGSLFEKDFQGEVSMTMKDAKNGGAAKAMNMVIGIARPSYRMDIGDASGPKGAMILDITTKKGWFLVPAQKTAMLVDFNQPIGQRGIPGLPGGPSTPGRPTLPSTPPTITKTGQKDTVAGYVCDVWNIVSNDGHKATVCLAENLTWFDVSEFAMQSPELAAAAAISDANHFPLRAVSYDAKGVEETRMEATKIEKKTLAATEFSPPPDYKVIDLAKMMQGLGQPGQPGAPALPAHH